MTADPPPPSFKDLAKRLDDLRERQGLNVDESKGGGQPPASSAAMGLGFRVGVELVVGVVGGGGIGWLLDKWLNTRPFLMLLFLVLGAAAGMLNVYRLLRALDAPGNDKNRPA